MRIKFDEIPYYAEKVGRCEACGRSASRTKRFFQTLNPFNKNEQGLPKTQEEILNELRLEAEAWEKEPIFHAKCEKAESR